MSWAQHPGWIDVSYWFQACLGSATNLRVILASHLSFLSPNFSIQKMITLGQMIISSLLVFELNANFIKFTDLLPKYPWESVVFLICGKNFLCGTSLLPNSAGVYQNKANSYVPGIPTNKWETLVSLNFWSAQRQAWIMKNLSSII